MSLDVARAPTHMTTAIKQQAAAVQNTWYTVLDTIKNVEIHCCTIRMQTLAEDLEVRWTIDGLTMTGSQGAAVAGTIYYINRTRLTDSLTLGTTAMYANGYVGIKCRSFKLEMRKTSANGANRLDGTCVYSVL